MVRALLVAAWSAFLVTPVLAANEGQADLDRAVENQLTARTPAELQEVVNLCESALAKGLSEENKAFATQILTSALFERASKISAVILSGRAPGAAWVQLREAALTDLEKALEYDDTLADAQLLLCRLEMLPGGDRERAGKAAHRAVELLEDDKQKLAAALVLRAQLGDDPKKQMADLTKAMELDPGNTDAWQIRALLLLQEGEFEEGAAELEKLLKENGDNAAARIALAEAYFNLERYDDALAQADKAVTQSPEASIGYTLRARIHAAKEDYKSGIADLNQALLVQPRDLGALLLRARLNLAVDEVQLAKGDVQRLLQLNPGLPQAIYMRALIAAGEGNFGAAIQDMEQLVKLDEGNVEWQLQLGAFYAADERPRRAIEIYTTVIDNDQKNWMARRARADALLSIGKQAEAIKDYEIALQQQPEHDGILNNLAWVLATSPKDELRDGKRSIELGTKACEVTEYKRPHILSTLAAGYAESGDFETAIKWSSKAVEMGEGEIKEQLQKELDSYKQGKPWRELQETEEKKQPVNPADLQT